MHRRDLQPGRRGHRDPRRSECVRERPAFPGAKVVGCGDRRALRKHLAAGEQQRGCHQPIPPSGDGHRATLAACIPLACSSVALGEILVTCLARPRPRAAPPGEQELRRGVELLDQVAETLRRGGQLVEQGVELRQRALDEVLACHRPHPAPVVRSPGRCVRSGGAVRPPPARLRPSRARDWREGR